MHQITEGLLKNNFNVKVVALNFKGCEVCPKDIPGDYKEKTRFEAITIDNRVKVLPAFLNLFSSKSYNVARFHSRKVEDYLAMLLSSEEFDIIQLEGLYLTPYIPVLRKYSAARLIFRSHNIEHFIWQRLACTSKNPLKSRYLSLLASRLKKYELEVIHKVDGLVAISPIDLEFFKKNGFEQPAEVVPVAMPRLVFPEDNVQPEPGSVFHLGSMDWRPNQEGIEWFLEKVWPIVNKQAPDMKFYLAGKRLPRRYFKYASESVIIAGEVPSAVDFMAGKQIMVVPLLSGGGMRVKIIEGMAAGKAIISTTIGAEGIGSEDGKHLLIADQADKMASLIVKCYQNNELMASLGSEAMRFVEDFYEPNKIIQKLIKFYQVFSA
jgi:glycosyltransferase involved in cell wall biosynthesis